jgi:hypothetical protein
MANSGGEDEDWGEGSGDEEEIEEGDDDLIEEQPSASRDSAARDRTCVARAVVRSIHRTYRTCGEKN